MIMVLARNLLLPARVPVAMRIKVTRGVSGVVMVLARHLLLAAGIAVAVGVEITGSVSRMLVMLAGLLFGQFRSPAFVR